MGEGVLLARGEGMREENFKGVGRLYTLTRVWNFLKRKKNVICS